MRADEGAPMQRSNRNVETGIIADGLQRYPARLKSSPVVALHRAFWKMAGSALAILSVLPFMSGAAKANVHPLGLSSADNPVALQDIAAGKHHGIQVAGHTDVPHQDSNPHGDHTDPWGNHVDVQDHVDGAHMNTTTDDDG
jgi:hypothetical protein